jgi:septum formation inhibitor MinC
VPRTSRSFLGRRSFNTSSNLALLLKNYMIPTIRVEQDVQSVARSLEKKVGLAPLFYQNAPVVLDFEPSEGIHILLGRRYK